MGCTATGTVGAGRDLGCPQGRFAQELKEVIHQVLEEGHGVVVEGLEIILVLIQKSDDKLLMLGGVMEGKGIVARMLRGSMCGNVMSGKPAGTREPLGEPWTDGEGVT